MSLLQILTGVEWQGRKHPEDRFGYNNQKIYFYRPQGKGVSKGAICLQWGSASKGGGVCLQGEGGLANTATPSIDI